VVFLCEGSTAALWFPDPSAYSLALQHLSSALQLAPWTLPVHTLLTPCPYISDP
jgi:hypothetical protein